jgi:hypothetical protein
MLNARGLILAVLAALGVLAGGLSLWSAPALAGSCPNEAFRIGLSAALPDCRAYEQVTPVEKGRAQDITFEEGDSVVTAEEGAAIELTSYAPLEPGATQYGTRAVFTRTSDGWKMTPLAPAGEETAFYHVTLANPNLSLVGFSRYTVLNELFSEFSPETAFVGGLGGPYTELAKAPFSPEAYTELVGADSDFNRVLFISPDLKLVPQAEGTDAGRSELYEWSKETGKIQPVNLTTGGALLDKCGAILGGGTEGGGSPSDAGDVSRDGSKVFFLDHSHLNQPCAASEPVPGLFMRVDGRETVEISAPEPGAADPAGKYQATFQGATPDGSQVLFGSEAELTTDDHSHAQQLYDYDTLTGKLTRVTRGESGTAVGRYAGGHAISEDGSTIYFSAEEPLTVEAPASRPPGANSQYLYRYETATGKLHYIALVATVGEGGVEPTTTPDGNALLLGKTTEAIDGPQGFSFQESGGENDQQMIYFNAAENKMTCVSCLPGTATPGTGSGRGLAEEGASVLFHLGDGVDRPHYMSDDGDMVFFNTTSQLVPQDTNSTVDRGYSSSSSQGLDVYEWEHDGTGGCEVAWGCVHLLSSGTGEQASLLLGASADGSNVYFATASQLVPADKDEFDDIYDARIDGGFPSPEPSAGACLSCQGVGSPAPLFNTPASASFFGAGNSVSVVSAPVTGKAHKAKGHKKKRRRVKRRGSVKRKGRGLARRASRSSAGSSDGRGL